MIKSYLKHRVLRVLAFLARPSPIIDNCGLWFDSWLGKYIFRDHHAGSTYDVLMTLPLCRIAVGRPCDILPVYHMLHYHQHRIASIASCEARRGGRYNHATDGDGGDKRCIPVSCWKTMRYWELILEDITRYIGSISLANITMWQTKKWSA